MEQEENVRDLNNKYPGIEVTASGIPLPLRTMENLPAGIVFRDGNRVTFNKMVEAIIGYQRSEITTVDDWFTILHGENAGVMYRMYEQDRAANFPTSRLVTLIAKDGQMRWVEVAACQDQEGEIWLLIDRTQRAQVENALRESESRYRRLAQENAQLLREVNHRVGNNLALLLGLVQQMQATAAPEIRDMLQDWYGRLQSMAETYRLLGGTQWKALDLADLAEKVIDGVLFVSCMRYQIQYHVISPDEPVHVAPKQAFKLALIFNELTTNSLKYAFRGCDEGHLTVKIRVENGWGGIEFADDGPGWPADVLQGLRQDVGLGLVRGIIEHEMQGEVILYNDNGAVIECRFALRNDDEI
ncbi:MAG: PAS domain S-box protein [Anaerolineae bacterium]|nr:PAS domain S-box protein [Anaerolineae bacterium]